MGRIFQKWDGILQGLLGAGWNGTIIPRKKYKMGRNGTDFGKIVWNGTDWNKKEWDGMECKLK